MTSPTLSRTEMRDKELMQLVRNGDLESYGTLYERHVKAAYNLARQLTSSTSEQDDLVSEAFAKVLDYLIAGKGPDKHFRAYLLTTLRHTCYDKTRKNSKVELRDCMDMMEEMDQLTIPFLDTAVADTECNFAAKAFDSLPELWHEVLYYTEVEKMAPAKIAPILGITANSVSARAYRARAALRQAYEYLQLDAESRRELLNQLPKQRGKDLEAMASE